MLLIVGTVPIEDLPVIHGEVKSDGEFLTVDGHQIPCFQGTAAMISAAVTVTEYLKKSPPHALLAGDIGVGNGSRAIFKHITENADKLSASLLALHYCLPIVVLFRRAFDAIIKAGNKPYLLADAGAMYAAKTGGLAEQFDAFTPDLSELAYLADPKATHPAYVARYLADSDPAKVPGLIADAYKNHAAPKLLVVKGQTDYIVEDGKIVATISEPDVPMLEPIGGTGDTITGLLAALIYSDIKPVDAAIMAARINRLAGQMANVTPETRVKELIDCFKKAFPSVLPVN
jgi:hypothetical protein